MNRFSLSAWQTEPLLAEMPMARTRMKKTTRMPVYLPQRELYEELGAIVTAADTDLHSPIGHVVEHGSGNGARAILATARGGVPGDLPWVWEAWANCGDYIRYAATDDIHDLRKRHPPIHMPWWASRLTLEVTNVRLQRLQGISEKIRIGKALANGRAKNARSIPVCAFVSYGTLFMAPAHGKTTPKSSPSLSASTTIRWMNSSSRKPQNPQPPASPCSTAPSAPKSTMPTLL
jgi:hypothetical protein